MKVQDFFLWLFEEFRDFPEETGQKLKGENECDTRFLLSLEKFIRVVSFKVKLVLL